MPIEVACTNCQQKLRVADTFAGKKARCPKCQAVVQIPASGGAANNWMMQTPDGQEFGPISKAELDAWVAEGRIDRECQVWQQGWDQRRWADEIFPQLAAPQAPAVAPNPMAAMPQGPAAPALGPRMNAPLQAPVPNAPYPAAPVAQAMGMGYVPPANPYASPGGPTMMGGGSGGGDDASNPAVLRALAETRPWVLFLAILGFIGTALIVLAAVFMLIGASRLGLGGFGFGMAFGYLILAGLYGLGAYFLMAYASAIGSHLLNRSQRSLTVAMIAQKTFWRYAGIVTIVFIVLYVIVLVVGLAAGFSAAPTQPMRRF